MDSTQRQNPPIRNPLSTTAQRARAGHLWQMKWASLLGSLVLVAFSAFAQSDYDNLSTSRGKAPPHRGMTRGEARKRYGEPFQRTALSDGERWLYRLKFDEVYGRALVPFYISSDNVRLGTIDFGPDGRVREFVWQRVGSGLVN